MSSYLTRRYPLRPWLHKHRHFHNIALYYITICQCHIYCSVIIRTLQLSQEREVGRNVFCFAQGLSEGQKSVQPSDSWRKGSVEKRLTFALVKVSNAFCRLTPAQYQCYTCSRNARIRSTEWLICRTLTVAAWSLYQLRWWTGMASPRSSELLITKISEKSSCTIFFL